MKASEFLQTLPATATAAREEAIVRFIQEGGALPIHWWAVRTVDVTTGTTATFYTATDALMVGEADDYVRVNVTHLGAQRIADMLGMALPTPKISDLTHTQATVICKPQPQTPDKHMADTSRMLQHSESVSQEVGGRVGLVSTVGKDWVLTNRLIADPTKAANYGWHTRASNFQGPGGMLVLQPLGLAHECHHTDYSQTLRLVHRRVSVNDQDMLLEDVLTDAKLYKLLSYEQLRITRHPGVPCEKFIEPAALLCGG